MVPYLENQGATPGRSVTGQQSYVDGLAASWRYGFTFKIWSQAEHLAWRAFSGQCKGSVNIVRVPVCDCKFNLAATSGLLGAPAVKAAIKNGVPHSDDSPHSDGANYAGPHIYGVTFLKADSLTTEMVMTFDLPAAPLPGHFFSNSDIIHLITSTTLISANRYLIQFEPGLRDDVMPGEEFSFSELSFLAHLSDETMLRVERDLLKFAMHTIEFEEYTP
jgi:hypothetical protein